MCALQDVVGQTVRFESQPYHVGTLKITRVELLDAQYGLYGLVGDAECSERSSLLGHSMHRPKTMLGHLIYRFTEQQVRHALATDQPLIHVYPV